MIHENVDISGSLKVSGSFSLPRHASSANATATTGSMYHDTTDNVAKIYTGTGWVIVGEQTAPVVVASADIEYLLVAGGGGGGGSVGGGGGAGGFLSSSLSSIESGSSITVTVGAGGTGGVTKNQGSDGSDSSIVSSAGTSFSTITSTAGGAGGASRNTVSNLAGNSGGSGGGGSWYSDSTGNGKFGGSGTVGQGNDGGDASGAPSSDSTGGGGGGAGAAGGNGIEAGRGGLGGDGKQSSITGVSTYYAGGGGGGGQINTAAGGQGGGGTGQIVANSGENGTANTGGGGGASYNYSGGSGGTGGSGVAIFAYNTGSINCAGGIVGINGGRKYHQFNASDIFKVGSTSDFQIVTDNLVLSLDAGDFASRGASTWTDLSTNGVNQTVSSATLGANFYYNFNGSSDYITINQNGASTASSVAHTGYGNFTGAYNNPYTFEFWIKTTDSGGDALFGQPIIGDTLGDLYGQISLRGGKLSYSLYDSGWTYVESTTSINDGSWHHCVIVHYANQTVDLYVDNNKEANGASLALATTRYFKMLYLMRGYSTEYMAGDLAQLRLYDTTLTAAQVAQNYGATKTNFV